VAVDVVKEIPTKSSF